MPSETDEQADQTVRMIPGQLSEWTIDAITLIVAKGVFECDAFDFKEKLPEGKDERGKERLRRVCASFANAAGGFLVFGVSDAPTAKSEERLVGVDRNIDFPARFGVFAASCVPPVEWVFLNPPLETSNSRFIHVVEIRHSWRAPHGVSRDDVWWFCSRSSSGTRHLSYQEIQMLFLNTYEKQLRLQLLAAELSALLEEADRMMVQPNQFKAVISDGHLSLEVIEGVIADTYSITHTSPLLLREFQNVRRHARAANTFANQIREMHARSVVLSERVQLKPHGLIGTTELEWRNQRMTERIRDAREAAVRAIQLLEEFLS